MAATYSLERAKIIGSHVGVARFLAECKARPVAYLARCQVSDIPSPYAYSPSKQILEHRHYGRVVWFETAHRVYQVFKVPAGMLTFTTDGAATDYHCAQCVAHGAQS